MGAIVLGPPLAPDSPQDGPAILPGIGGLLDASHVGLAREIAQGIMPLEDIARAYNFDGTVDPRWSAVLQHPEFQRLLAEAVREWNSAEGTAKRVRFKAAAMVESNLTVVHEIINNPSVPAIQRIEAFKASARLAGMGDGAAPNAGKGGNGFSVTINIGKDQSVRLTGQRPAPPVIDGDSDSALESDSVELTGAN